MNKALITDIQRASLHDGSGIRTTVFFKGCPLSCAWCHNPECISFESQTLFYAARCISCGKCHEGCYAGARVICGHEMTVDDVLAEIRQDKTYYQNGGGVTFSGGEPMAQKDFLNQLIPLCKAEGIGCAIETSLIYYDEEIFRQLDFIMADLKVWDDGLHKRYTGVGNVRIKEHFQMLNRLNIPIVARTPVIPEIEQGIEQISHFLKGLSNVVRYELLPYHPLGNSKRQALGENDDGFTVPTLEYMKELNRYAFIR